MDYVRGLCKDVIQRNFIKKKNSDSLDQVFLNQIFGLPVFVLIMYLVFSLSMTFSEPLLGLSDLLKDFWLMVHTTANNDAFP